MDEDDKVSPQAKGGHARADSLSPEVRKDIAQKAAKARWENPLPKATHEGKVTLGAIEIPCAVLADGRRLITQSGFMRALGRARQAKGREYYKGDVNLPAFLTANNLKPFISNELEVTSSQIEFKPLKGARAFGYSAELLPSVCEVFLDAADANALTVQQEHIAQRAQMIVRGLARVGIVALVDEATGYQEVRDKHALQAILDQFLRKEFAAWAKTFPDEFYQQIFRLRGWEWKGMKVNRPQVVAKYTNDIVYARLAPGVLDELQKRNPKNERGSRKSAHFQWLTEDVGHPALAQHLYGVIGFMRAADSWEEFKRILDRAFPKRGDTLQLQLVITESPNASPQPS